MSRMAIAAKGVGRMMAITDGTAGPASRLVRRAMLGGRRIRVTDQAAILDDGTLAGSTLTMDRAFATIVKRLRLLGRRGGGACVRRRRRASWG